MPTIAKSVAVPTSLHTPFQAVRQDLNSVLLERETTIDNALLALLTGQHFLQLGQPGIGKSLLVTALQQRITDAQQFTILLNPSTTPDEVFGPVDLIELSDHGRYTRRRTGSITEAHLVFLDECFKSNSVVLNGLLKIINERILTEIGMADVKVPLVSLFAASNETPQEASLRAFDDRFLLREEVLPCADEASLIMLFTNPPDVMRPQATLSLTDIQQAQQALRHVKGTPEVLQAALSLRQSLSKDGVAISDRRWTWSGPLLKARAFLDGRGEIDLEDLTCLAYAWWKDLKEMKTVHRAVYQAACPLYLRALDMEDQAVEIFHKLPVEGHTDFPAAAENGLQQFIDLISALKGDIAVSSARNLEKPRASLAKIIQVANTVKRQLFHRVSRLALDV